MPSDSLGAFHGAMNLPRALLDLHAQHIPDDRVLPPRSLRPLAQALQGGAVVLMVAAFENFLKDLFEQQIGRLAGPPPPVTFDSLPEKMRVASIFNSLRGALDGDRIEGPSSRVDRLVDIYEACNTVALKAVDPIAFTSTGSNPRWEVVRQLFDDAGVHKKGLLERVTQAYSVESGSDVPHDFVSTKLDEIVRARNDVAHGESAARFSTGDVGEWHQFLLDLGGVLSGILEAHVTDILDSNGVDLSAPPRRRRRRKLGR